MSKSTGYENVSDLGLNNYIEVLSEQKSVIDRKIMMIKRELKRRAKHDGTRASESAN